MSVADTVPYFDNMMGKLMDEWISLADGVLLGRKTYEIFAAHWPYVTGDDPLASKLNSVRKYVASRALNRVDWNNSTLIKGDVVDAVARLKREPGGELQVTGSGVLIQTLLKHNLIDEYRLLVLPVLLGNGKRLFADGTVPAGLKLIGTKASSTGVAIHIYQSAGKLAYGSFALEQPSAEEIERRQRLADR